MPTDELAMPMSLACWPANGNVLITVPPVYEVQKYFSTGGLDYKIDSTQYDSKSFMTRLMTHIKIYINLTWHRYYRLLESIYYYRNQYFSIYVLLLLYSSIFRSNPSLIPASPTGTTVSSAELRLSSLVILALFFLSGRSILSFRLLAS
jgi:hypothetical protein